MTIAYWCVFFSILFPYFFCFLAKAGGLGYNHHQPREYLQQLRGWRQRADWVQSNSFEALPAFAAAIIIAELMHTSQGMIDTLAVTFVSARIAYALGYLLDWAILRTVFWLVGYASVLALFLVR